MRQHGVEQFVVGKPAVIEADDPVMLGVVELLLEPGITGPAGEDLLLDDGEAFVAALPEALRGSRFWAEPAVL